MKGNNGLEISTNMPEVVQAVDDFANDLLSMGKNAINILEHADNYQESSLIQSLAATFLLYGQTKETDKKAKKYLERARSSAPHANNREKLFLSAINCWSQGKIEEATKQLENLIKEWPKDLTSMKVLEFLYYLRGQQYSGHRFLNALEGIHAQNKESGYFLSSFSFATELCGQYERAQDLAAKALDLEAINPWAHHTLSHVLLKTGTISDGIKILESYDSLWDQSGQAICSHNYWHLALMYLENLEHQKALSFVDEHILKAIPYLVIQHLDSISLLWRIEMGGHEVPIDRWKSIANIVKDSSGDCYIPYNSAHYIYALAKAEKKEDLNKALSSIKESIPTKIGHEKNVWEKTGIPLLEATKSFAEEDYANSTRILDSIIDEIETVGGSDAQVDLFRQTYLLSLIKSNDHKKAKSYLTSMITSETPTPLEDYWLSLIETDTKS